MIFMTRNREFYRDRSALGWSIFFPFFIIIGFSLIFNQENRAEFKIGVLETAPGGVASGTPFKEFMSTRFMEFVPAATEAEGTDKLAHHRIDLLIDPSTGRYWKAGTSPRGYIAEKILLASSRGTTNTEFTAATVTSHEVPYIEWLFPGILAMNIMFSALFGVGYVVVRDRKNGVLKRFSVTPLRPFEFLTGHIISRLFVIFATSAIVYIGCKLIYGFENRGSTVSLIFIFMLGAFSMVSLSLIIASRSSSEEFAGGILNLLTWPMMFLSEVWFSLEGARPWVRNISRFLPLTHVTEGTRRIMNDGASLYDIRFNVMALAFMSVLFLAIGSFLFKWHKSD